MTVLECLDVLAALLTKSDLLPDCNHERCMDMAVCALTQFWRMVGCLAVADGGMWVSTLLSSLCFLKGGNGKTEAQTQASLPALNGFGAWWRKDT